MTGVLTLPTIDLTLGSVMDFTTWTETDTTNKLSQTIPRATWTDMIRNEDCYLSKTLTVSGNFIHRLDFELDAIDVNATAANKYLTMIWQVCESAGSPIKVAAGKGVYLVILEKGSSTTEFNLYFTHADNVVDDTSVDLDVGTIYYLKITRVTNVFTVYIYTDKAPKG